MFWNCLKCLIHFSLSIINEIENSSHFLSPSSFYKTDFIFFHSSLIIIPEQYLSFWTNEYIKNILYSCIASAVGGKIISGLLFLTSLNISVVNNNLWTNKLRKLLTRAFLFLLLESDFVCNSNST